MQWFSCHDKSIKIWIFLYLSSVHSAAFCHFYLQLFGLRFFPLKNMCIPYTWRHTRSQPLSKNMKQIRFPFGKHLFKMRHIPQLCFQPFKKAGFFYILAKQCHQILNFDLKTKPWENFWKFKITTITKLCCRKWPHVGNIDSNKIRCYINIFINVISNKLVQKVIDLA